MTKQYNVSVTTITFLITGISICTLVLSQSYTAMAQQQPTGTSFELGNVTFSHTAAVNGIQISHRSISCILVPC
jgi:hypothetical protein